MCAMCQYRPSSRQINAVLFLGSFRLETGRLGQQSHRSMSRASISRSPGPANGYDTFSSRTYLGRRQTCSHGLVARSATVRCDKGRRAVVGWAEDNGFIDANGVQIEDRAGTREKDDWPRNGSTAPENGDQ